MFLITCSAVSADHEELWQPAWGVRTGEDLLRPVAGSFVLGLLNSSPLAIIGMQGFFPLKGTAAVGVGALEYPTAERKRLAALYVTSICHAPEA